jgi:divalent metal cation (Fe/Co/Zn/Cd) transporter
MACDGVAFLRTRHAVLEADRRRARLAHVPFIAGGGRRMTNGLVEVAVSSRDTAVRRGRHLEYLTIGYNCLEGLVALVAGIFAGSIALVGFGIDSCIEVASGAALLWRLHADGDERRRERAETTSLRIVGACFVALAVYVACDAAAALVLHEAPERSIPGIILAAVSVVAMPLLARAKRRVARVLSSGAMRADAKQTELCTYLSAILLGGLILNALLGWWWADPVAALAMVPIIAKEGIEALRGKTCCDDACH